MRKKLETLMTLLECSAAEAATIHLLNHIANNTQDMASGEPEDDYGPGANPSSEEED